MAERIRPVSMSSRTPKPLTALEYGAPPPDWDAMWRDADLPDEDRDAWREALAYRTKVPNDAVVLARYGWTPADVIAARTDPTVYWPDGHKAFASNRSEPARGAAALAVLTEETARWHDSRAGLALEVRSAYIRDLVENLPSQKRWSMEQVGNLLGLTRQRVRAIVKRKGLQRLT